MPEYLAPAVYVEETSFRAKSIEGVSTSTTAFVGPTRKGPTTGTPELITSFGDFERIYGGFGNLSFSGGVPNYIAHAIRNYYDNGGSRLFVARVYMPPGGGAGVAESAFIGDNPDNANNIRFVARTPGTIGNGQATVNLVPSAATAQSMLRAPQGTMLNDGSNNLFIRRGDNWFDSSDTPLPGPVGAGAAFVTINVLTRDDDANETFYEDMGFTPGHPRYIGDVLSATPTRRIEQLENTFAIAVGTGVTPFRLHEILAAITNPITLANGSDGGEPNAGAYIQPLLDLARVEEISIIAAPGYSSFADRNGIQEALLTHVETRRAYRFAVLDAPANQTVTEALTVKSRIDSTYAALYYPWVVTSNPLSRPNDESIPREIMLPPSGFICGIFARNDVNRSVSKSPGNEIVRGAIRFETDISFAEQEVLNPRGVNCLRFFPGRGYRLWGARTTSSDPEWKYVGPRRYFIYLEHSIDRSTQWAVFENNGPRLWSNIRETVSDFLYNEWRSGALLGSRLDEAYFVRCDRSTMTQNDLDNGRLICLIGVAVLKPAEFVIFRIGQKTADARN
ncbi:MAG: phage tail sheath subtilisin-like domain-containing protein [Proteobacteria bacterium]|nr:phage tail sheath subtilisin-like domain-containing protein [Pseudomonadota bacterium]MBU4295147.1 phage tail sheath subtilisin-like domain-containing protein [Pseudomonadota bacterium]MCG2747011.1 phage tail sheath subtilisin-like domain-containing protein [Desulfobulbaceae bacterium]